VADGANVSCCVGPHTVTLAQTRSWAMASGTTWYSSVLQTRGTLQMRSLVLVGGRSSNREGNRHDGDSGSHTRSVVESAGAASVHRSGEGGPGGRDRSYGEVR